MCINVYFIYEQMESKWHHLINICIYEYYCKFHDVINCKSASFWGTVDIENTKKKNVNTLLARLYPELVACTIVTGHKN